jgi:hypothetical protein
MTARVFLTFDDNMRPNRPHFRPHISATPRDETDTELHVFMKTIDMRNETDTEQPTEGSF